MECFKCEKDYGHLIDVISKEGIVKVCQDCLREEDLPIVSRRTPVSKPPFLRTPPKRYEKSPELKRQEKELKKILDRNYTSVNESKPSDLVDNFHWILMRARRMKKLTQEQFAKEIKESETAIKMAEKGTLPEKYPELIKKIEAYLSIRLFKENPIDKSFEREVEIVKENLVQGAEKGDLKFNDLTTRTLTISDLQDMKKQKEEIVLNPEKNPNKPEFVKKGREISQEDIDKIIFWR